MAAGSRSRLTESDAYAFKQEIPGIVASAPTVRGQAQVVVGNANWSTSVQGIDLDYMVARNVKLSDGRSFEPREVSTGARVVLLGATVAQELFGEANVVGQSVRLNNVPFEVTGVLASKGQTSFGQDQDDVVMVPLSTARTRLLGKSRGVAGAVNVIMVSVAEESMMAEVERHIGDLLRQRHRLRDDNENAFRVRNLSEMVETRAETSRVFNSLLAAVASISLLVGGIGIMNIMLVSVTERTREIGLRRAVGAKAKDILLQFIVEAITLCTVGGILGILIALVITMGFAQIAGWPVALQWEVIVLAVLFSAAIGVFFGYYPAHKAAGQDPIEALRFE